MDQDSASALRRVGKTYATAYDANEAQGGTAVTRPPWSEACCTKATIHMQKLATAMVRRMYLWICQPIANKLIGKTIYSQ